MNVCVFCASNQPVAPAHLEVARGLGAWIGARGHALVWGGCNVGLMDAIGRATREAGGRTIAVIPRFLVERGLAFAPVDEQVVTDDLAERKRIFRERGAAFVALPGGVGTWEEVLEVMALRKLGQLAACVVLANVGGFYDPLLAQFERSVAGGFSPGGFASLCGVARDAGEIAALLEA